MAITLNQILSLVGNLDDTPGSGTPRERFRSFLRDNVTEVGPLRDYVEECLRTPGDQYSRALQDLINHLGKFLGFEVTFGRYQGVQGQIGFDGHWTSPKGFHLVIEVKTTEVYAIKTATLVGYVDALISEKQIPDWDRALGLYVIGKPDPEIPQLEHAILAEKRTHQLRIISADSLLSLAEMMAGYDVSHDAILSILRPSSPTIDPIVDLMERLVAEPTDAPAPVETATKPELTAEGETAYWLAPVGSDEEHTAEQEIQTLVGKEHIYAFGDRAPGRKRLKAGDQICFYATAKGVMAHARVASPPALGAHPKIRHPDKYRWLFRLDNVKLYLDQPIVIDSGLRGRLDAFKDRDINQSWAWFVQATRSITAHDFGVLTGQGKG